MVLAVGHSERFNPAVAAARPYVNDPRFIEVHRLGTQLGRSLDIDVVLDLMIHDLDLILSLVPSDVESVEAVGVPVLTPKVDIANARLRFANGCIANLTASRISRDQVRKIRFFQRERYVSIDTAAREVEMYQLVPQPGALPKIDGGKLTVPGDEPLKSELEDFVAAVRERRAPAVHGRAGPRRAGAGRTNRGVDAAVNINLAIAERARAGEALTAAEIDELGSSDILSLGMLADEVRRARWATPSPTRESSSSRCAGASGATGASGAEVRSSHCRRRSTRRRR